MGAKNMEERRKIADRLRRRVTGNSNHPRWGKTGLRAIGNTRHYVLSLTVPAKVSREVADAYERDQQYTCQVMADGSIVFRPLPENGL